MNTDIDDDIDFNPIYQTYKSIADLDRQHFTAFIQQNPSWIIVPLSFPQFQDKFLPQDLSNLYVLLCIWLKENCKQRWQIFLGCLLFEDREDSFNFHQIWSVTRGTA